MRFMLLALALMAGATAARADSDDADRHRHWWGRRPWFWRSGERRSVEKVPASLPSTRYDDSRITVTPSDELVLPRPNAVSLELGMAVPMSDVDLSGFGGGTATNGAAGPSFGVRYLRFPNSSAGVGVELAYHGRSGSDSADLGTVSSRVSGDAVLLLGVVKLPLTNRGRVRPYLLGGGGVYRLTEQVDGKPDAGRVWSDTGTRETRRLIDDAAAGAAATARFGVDFGADPSGGFALELGWTGYTNARFDATAAGRSVGYGGTRAGLDEFTFSGRYSFDF